MPGVQLKAWGDRRVVLDCCVQHHPTPLWSPQQRTGADTPGAPPPPREGVDGGGSDSDSDDDVVAAWRGQGRGRGPGQGRTAPHGSRQTVRHSMCHTLLAPNVTS
jgi:hypothetical protein